MKHLKTYKIFESTKERDRELLQEYFNISYPEIEEIIQPVLNEYPELDWKISIINKKLFQIIFTKENISKEKYPFSTRLISFSH